MINSDRRHLAPVFSISQVKSALLKSGFAQAGGDIRLEGCIRLHKASNSKGSRQPQHSYLKLEANRWGIQLLVKAV